jgi:hypothetical protein
METIMRTHLLLVLAVGLLAQGSARPEADEATRAVIQKAIKAHGGEGLLGKFKAGRMKTRGKIEVGEASLPFSQDILYQLPGQFKELLELEANGQKVAVATVFNGEKGWIEVEGKLQDIDDKLQAELREAGHLMQLSRLTPLLQEARFKLSPVGEVKVQDRPAIGVRVECKGFRDVNLYFDKESGLLAKTERRALSGITMEEVTEERIVAEYRKVEGMQSPHKVVVRHDGKKFMEADVVEVKPLEQVDPKTFTRPASQ